LPSDFHNRDAILEAIRERGVDGEALLNSFGDKEMKEVG
jgi:alpha-D-ribose 1-methylphosphonate 5-triphosphate synthase subunit PhnL